MKVNLENILKTLGWPIGLTAVFSSVLGVFGVPLDTVMLIAGSMLGAQLLIGLTIDVLKWAGVVVAGTAGYWSAGLNLAGLACIAVTLVVNPSFNFPALDAQLVTAANFLTLLFGYVVQIAGTKQAHRFLVRGLGVKAFTPVHA